MAANGLFSSDLLQPQVHEVLFCDPLRNALLTEGLLLGPGSGLYFKI